MNQNEMAMRWSHANDPRPHPSERRPELGERFDAVVVQAMAIAPNERFQSGAAFAKALESTARGGYTPPHGTLSTAALTNGDGATNGAGNGYQPTRAEPQTPMPAAAAYAPGGTPPPIARRSPAKTIGAVLLVLLAAAGIAVGAVAASGGFSHKGHPSAVKPHVVSKHTPPTTSKPLPSQSSQSGSSTPATSPSTSGGTPPPQQQPSSADAAAAQAVVADYWSAINSNDFARAYGHYSQHERDSQAGSEDSWIKGHEQEGIQSAVGTFSASNLSGDTGTVNVDSLRTVDNANGCQTWTGNYSMVRQNGVWLIDWANLNSQGC